MEKSLIQKIKELASQEFADDELLAAKIKQTLMVYESKNPANDPILFDLKTLANQKVNNLISGENQREMFSSGYAAIDEYITGFSPGEFVIIGGRPSMGKTTTLANLSLRMSKKAPVLFFTYDLSPERLTDRFLAALSGVEVRKINSGNLSDSESALMLRKLAELEDLKIFLSTGFNTSVTAMRQFVEDQIEKNGIRIVMIDYVQMMSAQLGRQGREYEVAYISRELKRMANELNICVIVSSQLSRGPEQRGGDHRPTLTDLRESGALEQNADKVFFIHRPEYYGFSVDYEGNLLEGIVEFILAKNRTGITGNILMKRDLGFTGFKDDLQVFKGFEFDPKRLSEIEGINDILNLGNFPDDTNPF